MADFFKSEDPTVQELQRRERAKDALPRIADALERLVELLDACSNSHEGKLYVRTWKGED